MYQFSFPQPSEESYSSFESASEAQVTHRPKKKKSLEERIALREKRNAQRRGASRYHAETALRKYNKASKMQVWFITSSVKVLLTVPNFFFLTLILYITFMYLQFFLQEIFFPDYIIILTHFIRSNIGISNAQRSSRSEKTRRIEGFLRN